ncbi:MAG: anthranilate phosphoribosyltransferase, partial [Spirochaetaceae bacterium]|nr:anthranilate phosphoribosyltransferase [Spirochaetaceae bacterium]
MIREAILKAAARRDLSFGEAEQVMDEIMCGEASDIQMASYLTA